MTTHYTTLHAVLEIGTTSAQWRREGEGEGAFAPGGTFQGRAAF